MKRRVSCLFFLFTIVFMHSFFNNTIINAKSEFNSQIRINSKSDEKINEELLGFGLEQYVLNELNLKQKQIML